MKVTFLDQGWEDDLSWRIQDRKTLQRINRLIEECRRMPYRGVGKPEPLRFDWAGWWSGRITDEHRLIYRVVGLADAQALEIAQGRKHN